jgi:hypothetical protein
VNAFYEQFDWFAPLDVETVARERGDRSLGAYLERVFPEKFRQKFSKLAVTVQVIQEIDRLPDAVMDRFAALVAAIRARSGAGADGARGRERGLT